MKLRLLLCASLLFAAVVQARDIATYRVGDVADADITTPFALEVEDAPATAALRTIKSQQYPSVFRVLSDTTNAITRNFLAAFAQAQTNFLADVAIEFHTPALDEPAIASADFGRLVTVFGVENRNFPVTDDLAAEWARGHDGAAIRDKLVTTLQWVVNQHVRPDALPDGMLMGESVRLVPVTELNQKLSFETVQQCEVIPASSILTLSNAQVMFRREFPAGHQLFARALAAFIQPNCFPDAPFTELTRGTAVYKVVVSDHFDTGDLIAHRGDTLDAKQIAAITALANQLKSAAPPPAAAATPKPSAPVLAAVPPAPIPFKPVPIVSPPMNNENLPSPPAAALVKTGFQHLELFMVLAGISVLSLLVAAWQYFKERKPTSSLALAAQPPLPFPTASLTTPADPSLAPQVALAVREAVQRELAAQRRELLRAQQAATDEIAALVLRLDELQMPMQERLHTYESRIHKLEEELALRNEENKELLKMKIEMISRQLETERKVTVTTTTSTS